MEYKDNDSFIGQQKEDFKNKYGNMFSLLFIQTRIFFLFLLIYPVNSKFFF